MVTTTKRYNPFTLRLDRKPEGLLEHFLFTFQGPLERISGLADLAQLYDMLPEGLEKQEFVQQTLELMNVRTEILSGSLDNIPKTGPVVVVANHPFGGIEGIILADLLNQRREDVKLMANSLLGRIPEIRDYFLFVDPFGRKESTRRNLEPLRDTMNWVKEGKILGVFPSNAVSHVDLKKREVSDPEWKVNIARIIRKTNATVVPVFFEGRNGWLFQLAGVIHPLLRTLLLPKELGNRQHSTIRLKIGQPIGPEKIASYDTDEKLMGALRLRTYLLADDHREKLSLKERLRSWFSGNPNERKLEPIVKEVDRIALSDEVEKLNPKRLLLKTDDFCVYCAKASEIPNVLREIGRLREITFREVGEGTGQSIDLDSFDQYYMHLFVWNSTKHEIVGAYRLGKIDVILRSFGKRGLYTYTLFKYGDDLLKQLSPALEVGRSFVRTEYQRSYVPLLLLWRGIGHFVVQNPKYAKLFGPVSINSEYESISRRLIITFLRSNNFLPDLAKLIKARNPLRHRPIRGVDANLAARVVHSVEEVNDLIAQIEKQQRTIPVLLRQYLKMGGKLLGFNVDPSFGNVLDGLLLVDLRETEQKLLERYLGKSGAKDFLAYHQRTPPSPKVIEKNFEKPSAAK